MRSEKEASRTAGGIADRLSRLRRHHVHHRGDECARGEILAGAAFHVLCVLLQQAFVRVALHVGRQAGPLLLVDQVDDEAAQLGRILDLVLSFAEDDAEHALAFAERVEHVPVVCFEIVAVLGQQTRPVVTLRHR